MLLMYYTYDLFIYWYGSWIIIMVRLWVFCVFADAYMRKCGLERSKGILKDLAWFEERGLVVPTPSSPGVTYAKYLEELAETSAPLFLSHFYNIHFSHIAAGQVIAKKVSTFLWKWDFLSFLPRCCCSIGETGKETTVLSPFDSEW